MKTKDKSKGRYENKTILIESEVTNYVEKINFIIQNK